MYSKDQQPLGKTCEFFNLLFGWQFQFYGPEYAAFSAAEAGIDGGFYQADLRCSTVTGGALLVLYSEELEQTQQAITAAGGKIIKPIFSFPGGRRFHFTEPSGNELAVWSDR